MRLGSILTLICGILILVGLSLSWFIFGVESASGYFFVSHGETNSLFTMIGGILMTTAALAVFIMSFRKWNLAILLISLAAPIGAVLAIVGTLEYSHNISWWCINCLGEGFFLSVVLSFIGLVCALGMVWRSKAQAGVIKPLEDIARPAAVNPNPVRGYTPSATRAHYESKAAKECLDRASAMEASGDRDKAIEEYTKSIKLDSKNAQAYFKRGLLLKEMGMKPAAISDFNRVVDTSDGPELVEKAKSYIAEIT